MPRLDSSSLFLELLKYKRSSADLGQEKRLKSMNDNLCYTAVYVRLDQAGVLLVMIRTFDWCCQ